MIDMVKVVMGDFPTAREFHCSTDGKFLRVTVEFELWQHGTCVEMDRDYVIAVDSLEEAFRIWHYLDHKWSALAGEETDSEDEEDEEEEEDEDPT